MSEHVKIKIGSCDYAGKVEAEFEASDEVVEILKNIIIKNVKILN
jgi:hypothetical protein